MWPITCCQDNFDRNLYLEKKLFSPLLWRLWEIQWLFSRVQLSFYLTAQELHPSGPPAITALKRKKKKRFKSRVLQQQPCALNQQQWIWVQNIEVKTPIYLLFKSHGATVVLQPRPQRQQRSVGLLLLKRNGSDNCQKKKCKWKLNWAAHITPEWVWESRNTSSAKPLFSLCAARMVPTFFFLSSFLEANESPTNLSTATQWQAHHPHQPGL